MYELEITQVQNRCDELAVSRSASALSGLKESTGRLQKKIADTDVRILGIFEELDSLSHQIDTLKEKIEAHERDNLQLMAQKKGLAEIRKEKIPNPKVIVNGCIVAGTKITGPNADVRLKWDHSNCIIQEKKSEDGFSSAVSMVVSFDDH